MLPSEPLPVLSDVPTIDLQIDITQRLCPMTFVYTRLALDRLLPGQVLAVRLKGNEPRTNVPASAVALGHTLLAIEDRADGTATLFIRKQPAPPA